MVLVKLLCKLTNHPLLDDSQWGVGFQSRRAPNLFVAGIGPYIISSTLWP